MMLVMDGASPSKAFRSLRTEFDLFGQLKQKILSRIHYKPPQDHAPVVIHTLYRKHASTLDTPPSRYPNRA